MRAQTLILLLLSVWLAAPTAGMTTDEVVARHIAARGGREAWAATGTLKIAGDFTAFSQTHPFKLYRTPDQRYHLDHMLGDKLAIIGWDGETPWWENHWYQEGAQRMTGADLAVLMRDIEYPLTPFFDLETAGHQLALLGEREIDGSATLALKLTRGDGSEETWYLDPETYLEVARDAPGSDFGQPMTRRTYFDAFQKIPGTEAIMPYYVESQWYTRDRVMDVTSVEIGAEVDDALFRMPPPIGMAPVLSMVGAWHVAVEQRQQPQAPWSSSSQASTITAEFGGALLRERSTAGPVTLERTLTFDRFRKHYVLTSITAQSTYLDIMQGTLEAGTITVSNEESGTTRDVFGLQLLGRMTLHDLSDQGFSMEHETSIDGGKTWFTDARRTYTKRATAADR